MNEFTLSMALSGVRKHLLITVLLFIATFFVLDNVVVFTEKFQIKKAIILGDSNDVYTADILDRDKLVLILNGAPLKDFVHKSLSSSEVAEFKVSKDGIKDKSVMLILSGYSVESISDTFNTIMKKLQGLDELEIGKKISLIQERIDIKRNDIKNLMSLSQKTNSISNNEMKEYVDMQKTYDLAYGNGNSEKASTNISDLLMVKQKESESKVFIYKRIREIELEIFTMKSIIKDGYKKVSYLFPESPIFATKYFPNAMVFFGISLMTVIFYNLIVINVLYRRRKK